MLDRALADLRAVAEQYPDLRATENFQQLSRNLSELEDEIQASRRIYNSNVQAYNTKIQVFPNSVVAGMGGFTAREFFEIEDAAQREPVEVSFTQPPAAATGARRARPPDRRSPGRLWAATCTAQSVHPRAWAASAGRRDARLRVHDHERRAGHVLELADVVVVPAPGRRRR